MCPPAAALAPGLRLPLSCLYDHESWAGQPLLRARAETRPRKARGPSLRIGQQLYACAPTIRSGASDEIRGVPFPASLAFPVSNLLSYT
jgi:hypothetical protein